MRVGLNAGEVVRAIGNDLHMDYSAVGRPRSWRRVWNKRPRREHLAARRHTPAGGGSGGSHRLRPMSVKGLIEPVEVFELTGVSSLALSLSQAAVARSDALCWTGAGAGGHPPGVTWAGRGTAR